MNKSIKFSLLLLLIGYTFWYTTDRVSAIELKVLGSGAIEIYEDQVLGKTSENRQPTVKPVPQKVVPAKPNQVIDVAPATEVQEKATVRIRQQINVPESEPVNQPNFAQIQETKSNRVEVKAQLKEEATQRIQVNRKEVMNGQLENRQQQRENVDVLIHTSSTPMSDTEDQEKLDPEVVIETNGTKAHFDSQVTLDQTNGQIMITTPSGNTHILQHLPDQAAEVLRAHNKLAAFSPDFELEADDEGNVTYSAQVERDKRLLGIFKRRITTELSLDDQTGEINETISTDQPVLTQLLDRLSF